MSLAVAADAELRARRTLDRDAYSRYLPLVRRTAMRLARRVPSTIAVSDLVGYGWIGLMEAYQRSDPNMPEGEFEAYALYRVRGAMLDYLRSLDPVDPGSAPGVARHGRAIRELSSKLGRSRRRRDRRATLDLRSRTTATCWTRSRRAEWPASSSSTSTTSSRGRRDDGRGRGVGKRRWRDAVVTAIDELPAKLVQVLALYYQEDCTLRQIGLVLGVTESRVSQLHTEAIHRLRAAVGRE